MTETVSVWQERITGIWYGLPAFFDADGRYSGFGRFERAVTTDNAGRPVFFIQPALQLNGPLRERIPDGDLLLRIIDQGGNRVYIGRDFFGSGIPYGSALLGSDYLQAWNSTTDVVVQLLPGGTTQAYSLLLYEGPTLVGAMLGGYMLAHDYDHNRATRTTVEVFLAAEQTMGTYPFSAAAIHAGRWTGSIEAAGPDGEPLGPCEMTIVQTPYDETHADLTVSVSGACDYDFATKRRHQGKQYFFDGPNFYGNGHAFGRALFTTRYVQGQALKIRGREMLLDEQHTLAVVWQLLRDGRPDTVLTGVLKWEEA